MAVITAITNFAVSAEGPELQVKKAVSAIEVTPPVWQGVIARMPEGSAKIRILYIKDPSTGQGWFVVQTNFDANQLVVGNGLGEKKQYDFDLRSRTFILDQLPVWGEIAVTNNPFSGGNPILTAVYTWAENPVVVDGNVQWRAGWNLFPTASKAVRKSQSSVMLVAITSGQQKMAWAYGETGFLIKALSYPLGNAYNLEYSPDGGEPFSNFGNGAVQSGFLRVMW